MIRFFRQIRQRLLTDNKFSKYLLYAVGEILLVVIGILIALQIDRWNEANQNEEKVARLLRKIQRDIEADVSNIIDKVPYYARKDSIGNLILNDQLTKEDYQNPDLWILHRLIFDLTPMSVKKVGYDNLRETQDIIPLKYDSIVERLIYQYDDVLKIFEKTHDFLLEDVRKNEEYMFRNYDWFSSPQPYHLNENRIDFFLNNIKYKGMVSNYLDASTGHYVRVAAEYLESALDNYTHINIILGTDKKAGVIYDSTELDKRYLGDYKLIYGDTITAFLDSGRFFIQGNRLRRLFPYGKNKLFAQNLYLRFESKGDSLCLYSQNYKAGRIPIGVKIK